MTIVSFVVVVAGWLFIVLVFEAPVFPYFAFVFVVLSFCRTIDDVICVNSCIDANNNDIQLLAKALAKSV